MINLAQFDRHSGPDSEQELSICGGRKTNLLINMLATDHNLKSAPLYQSK